MEVKVTTGCKPNRDPMPGQMWYPDNTGRVFLCVSHYRGRAALGHTECHAKRRFYSVDLYSGTIHDTPCGHSNTVLLKWANGIPEVVPDTDC